MARWNGGPSVLLLGWGRFHKKQLPVDDRKEKPSRTDQARQVAEEDPSEQREFLKKLRKHSSELQASRRMSRVAPSHSGSSSLRRPVLGLPYGVAYASLAFDGSQPGGAPARKARRPRTAMQPSRIPGFDFFSGGNDVELPSPHCGG